MQASIDARRKGSRRSRSRSSKTIYRVCDKETLNLVASFQRAMVEDLVGKTLAAARAYDVATLFVTGGVAANQELRQHFEKDAAREGLSVYFPSRPLSTDNAAMIAAAAYPKFLAARFCGHGFFGRSRNGVEVRQHSALSHGTGQPRISRGQMLNAEAEC